MRRPYATLVHMTEGRGMPRPCGALCTRRVHATTASGKIGLPVNNRKNTGDFSTKRRATIQGAERAAELISAIRPFIRRFSSSDYSNALALGEVCLVVGWSGDIKQAQRQTLSSERVARIGSAWPRMSCGCPQRGRSSRRRSCSSRADTAQMWTASLRELRIPAA